MPVSPTYPGVYIEEVPSGVRTIVGVSTSVAGFVDYFRRGPLDAPLRLLSSSDFEREYGGLDRHSEASYGLQQFFLNGGSEAWVVRVARADTFATAEVTLTAAGGGDVLRVFAGRRVRGESVIDPGSWGNRVRLEVDHDTSDPETLFNLTVTEVADSPRFAPLRTETYRNLRIGTGVPNDAVEVINESSKLVQVEYAGALPLDLPAAHGTVGAPLAAVPGLGEGDSLQVAAGGVDHVVTLQGVAGASDFPTLRASLQRALRGATALGGATPSPLVTGATVSLTATPAAHRLRVAAGRGGAAFDAAATLVFTENGGSTAGDLGLLSGLAGGGEGAQLASLAGGGDASPAGLPADLPDAAALIGSRLDRTGLFALEHVDLFNVLALPRAAALDAGDARAVYDAAIAYCAERRAVAIVDVPAAVDEVADMEGWIDQNAGLRHPNAAVYFPRPRIADPLDDFRLRNVAASGTLAGLWARTDASRGVWKAPAGTEAALRGVQELSAKLTDLENGVLNPLGVNCLRNFPVFGNVSWGGRTLMGADQQASEWKYLPVRRLTLFIEESLYRGTQWAVFEPNDEPLWSQIRLNAGAFMQGLFRQGAFQGSTPREAYLVKCDRETTTQDDVNRGIVNVLIGFAPLKPAEFVIVKIQQLAGQTQA